MEKEAKRLNVAILAGLLDTNIHWIIDLLNTLGIIVQHDDTFLASDLVGALHKMYTSRPIFISKLSTSEIHTKICNLLERSNVTRVGISEYPTWVVKRPDEKTANLNVYFVRDIIAKTQLAGISIEMPLPPCRWVLFALLPWSRYELRNIEDLQKSRRAARSEQCTTFIHFAPGDPKWCFENRIQDFIDDPLAWA